MDLHFGIKERNDSLIFLRLEKTMVINSDYSWVFINVTLINTYVSHEDWM
jgi:hypothetical protein